MTTNNQFGFSVQELQLKINNEIIPYAPNTLKYNLGTGERMSAPYSQGAGSVLQVFSENIETKIGKVIFTMPVINSPINTTKKIIEWAAFGEFFLLSLTNTRDNSSIQFIQMILQSNNDVPTGNEAKVDIEFNGNPAFVL